MDKFVLNQLLSQPVIDPTTENRLTYDSYSLSSDLSDNKKLNRTERLIFLRMFRFLKKNYRRHNQFELAQQLKTIFKDADKLHVFEYFSSREYKLNSDNNLWEYTAVSENVVKDKFKMDNDFLERVGLTKCTLNSYFDYFWDQPCLRLEALNFYIHNATPAAIVQMNKRLQKIKHRL